ncbi:MAG TPA: DUF6692 family protein [Longimicrobiaceae bacterium]|nr:DUF6692 family protein [Longimicrobiaceae bacterium]
MTTRSTLIAVALVLGLTGCTENSAIGNDREAQFDSLEPPAERASAESLAQIDPGLLKPEPMTEADLASLRGSEALCRFRYTEVGFPVFLYPATGDAPAIIKLNGKLIPLRPAGGTHEYADGPVRVEMRHPDGVPIAGEEEAVLILRFDGASGELGFAGEAECP